MFDNCEHVVDSVADLVEAILAASATVTILATSREGLGVSEEQLWRVPSLDVNSGTESPAVNLFLDRAHSVVSDFSLAQPGEADAVVEICRRLDGIPLAIELAASRMASMTVSEVRDRLDQRFRLLVGSRRGLARHQTLRHAVAWSYDLLDEAEKALLERCSVFAGGFDLQSACAVMGSRSMTTPPWICSMRWCASRCWSPTGRRGGPGFRCWRRSASSPRNNSLPAAKHPRFGPPTRGTSPDAKPTSWPGGTAPANVRPTTGSLIELANLRTAFRWAADHGDLDVAATIASYAGLLGVWVQTLEPIAWAEELIEPARAADHPRLAFLYVIASQCYTTGRIEAAVGYSDAGQIVLGRSREALPYGIEAMLGAVYLAIGQPERLAELCRAQLARRRDTHVHIRAWLVVALSVAGSGGEAMDSADGLIEAAEATGNPYVARVGARGLRCRFP